MGLDLGWKIGLVMWASHVGVRVGVGPSIHCLAYFPLHGGCRLKQ